MVHSDLTKNALLAMVLTLGTNVSTAAQVLNYENDYVFRAQVGDFIETPWLRPKDIHANRLGFAYPVRVQAVIDAKQQSLIPSQKVAESPVIPAFHAIVIKKIKKADPQQVCLFDQATPVLCFALNPKTTPLEKMKVVFERIE